MKCPNQLATKEFRRDFLSDRQLSRISMSRHLCLLIWPCGFDSRHPLQFFVETSMFAPYLAEPVPVNSSLRRGRELRNSLSAGFGREVSTWDTIPALT